MHLALGSWQLALPHVVQAHGVIPVASLPRENLLHFGRGQHHKLQPWLQVLRPFKMNPLLGVGVNMLLVGAG